MDRYGSLSLVITLADCRINNLQGDVQSLIQYDSVPCSARWSFIYVCADPGALAFAPSRVFLRHSHTSSRASTSFNANV
jgi:hypothetical protein